MFAVNPHKHGAGARNGCLRLGDGRSEGGAVEPALVAHIPLSCLASHLTPQHGKSAAHFQVCHCFGLAHTEAFDKLFMYLELANPSLVQAL